ncbi:hypothetical protein [Kitasatospora sp. NPDC057223]|uniref:hypothetical protein n=1 Tax=Kitasatospora sp. NPDC057223 TaxID=3346055 RepID=UPI00363958E8
MTALRTESGPRTPGRPLRAVARVTHGPVPLDFDRLADRLPALQWGLALAGEADLELHLACTDRHELRAVVADLCRAGAARVQVELVLRRLVPAGATAAGSAPVVTTTPVVPTAPVVTIATVVTTAPVVTIATVVTTARSTTS